MTQDEHGDKRSSRPTGVPARPRGSGPTRRALLSASALLALVLLSATVAFADTRIGEAGSGPGQFESPEGLATSSQSGDVYVADPQNQRVDEFAADGSFVRAFGWGVVDGAAEPETCSAAGGCQAGLEGSGPGQLEWSDAIAVDDDEGSASYGDVYVVDQRNFRVEKFGPTGQFLLMFGGGVDHTSGADICTAADVAGGDTCGAGLPGTGPAHFYKEEPQTEAGGFKSWGDSAARSNSIAVGPDGKVYVGDYGRIQEFGPGGAFAGEFVLPVAAGEQPQFVTAIALDTAGDIFERSAVYGGEGGNQIVTQVAGVREFSPARVLLHTFDAEEAAAEPAHIALDAAGDLFVADEDGSHLEPPGGEFQIRAYKPTGSLYAVLTSDQLDSGAGTTVRISGIAVGPAAGDIYATAFKRIGEGGNTTLERYVAVEPLPLEGPPTVAGEHVGDIEPTSVTLHGVVDPRGSDTHYLFEYGTTTAYGHDAPEPAVDLGPVDRPDPVSQPITGLLPDTAYHYRLVAESTHGGGETVVGPDQIFTTLPATSVRDLTTQTVGPELVELKFELDPNGSAATYTVRYGTDTSYSGGSAEGTVSGDGFEALTATFTGLRPDTEYHYQLVATNAHGEVATTDRTFTTEESTAEELSAGAGCPNILRREEDDSLALPECRAYEQVSPEFKAGSAVGASAGLPYDELSPAGDHVAFSSPGTFAGAAVSEGIVAYIAVRTAAGWETKAVVPRLPDPDLQPLPQPQFDAALSTWLVPVLPGRVAQVTQKPVSKTTYFLGRADGSFAPISPELSILSGQKQAEFTQIVGQSADFSKIFVRTSFRLLSTDPRPDSTDLRSGHDRIYEIDAAAGSLPSLRLAAEFPAEFTHEAGALCEIDEPTEGTGENTDTASADGSTLFYSAPSEIGATPGSCGTSTANKYAVYARVGTAPALQLSAPSTAECHSPAPCSTAAVADAYFYGTSADGSLAWFTTTQPLIDGDDAGSDDLYLARLQDGRLTDLTQASAGDATDPDPGKDAGVQGVLRVSADGLRAYFVATGVLTETPNSLGVSAAPGADNLYVYDASSGVTKFVARLCSGPEESAGRLEAACPSGLEAGTEAGNGAVNDSWLWHRGHEAARQASLTPDGGFLLFRSFARLTPDDTDQAADLYRYDYLTGGLSRVSVGRDGNDGNGNDDAYEARIGGRGDARRTLSGNAEDDSRAISADGSTAVFETAAPLVSADTDGAPDVYEWAEEGHGRCETAGGCISLLSSGRDPRGAESPVISSSGDDVVFVTPEGLLAGDADRQRDVYDARVDGGFPASHLQPPCGSPEGCRPAPSPAAAAPKITTAGETGGNGVKPKQCAKGKIARKRHGETRCVAKKPHKKKHHKKKNAKSGHHQRADSNLGGGK